MNGLCNVSIWYCASFRSKRDTKLTLGAKFYAVSAFSAILISNPVIYTTLLTIKASLHVNLYATKQQIKIRENRSKISIFLLREPGYTKKS